MYVWTGLIFNKKIENDIRNICTELNRDYQLSELSFTLPQHISLKTSFDVPNYIEVLEQIKEIVSDQKIINLKIGSITKINNGIIWLDIMENAELRRIHNSLNTKLKEKFNIPLKGFDGENFHFHSTLFQDPHIGDKHEILLSKLKEKISLPWEIKSNEIRFGISQTGMVGTFREIDSLILN